MNQAKAAGPKTELVGVSSRIQQSIEDMIASVSRGIGDCMDNARDAVPQNPYERARHDERSDAMQMMSGTAELLTSIAKLKGEFSHTYTITRMSEKDRSKEKKEKEGLEASDRFIELAELMDPDEVEALSDSEREDYFRLLKLPALDLRPASRATTPLPETAGSNTDAGES